MAALRPVLPVTSRRVERLLVWCVAGAVFALILAGIAAVHTLGISQARSRAVVHAYRVEVAIGDARQLIEQTENARRGYVLSGSPLALASWREAHMAQPAAFAHLRALVRDRRQQAALARIERSLETIAAQHAATNTLTASGALDAAGNLYRAQNSPALFRPLRADFAAMAREERRLLDERAQAAGAALAVFYWTLGVVGIVIAILILVVLATLVRYTRDIDASRAVLRDLNETLEDQVAARTADLSRANAEIQRFAYIVSHDLRSPLVNVMGFTAELQAASAPLAELVDRAEAEAPQIVTEDARLAAREDLPEAIGFIRTSTQKMDRLINAILKLSREGRRVIAPEPVDLGALLDGIAGSLQHILEERGVALTIERPLPGVVSDRLAIEQILSNLIENATKYLQPGRPGAITVTGRDSNGRVVIDVADNGRGIDPRDHERVFDLFRRSGQQDQPGEGIGLAHVRALAYRLGGTIGLRSTLGEGATFTLNLPRTYQAQDML